LISRHIFTFLVYFLAMALIQDLRWCLTTPPLLRSLGAESLKVGVRLEQLPLRQPAELIPPDSIHCDSIHCDSIHCDSIHCDETSVYSNQLAAFLAHKAPTRRIGHYFEYLWEFIAQQCLQETVVCTNQQIRDHARTLGALDLLTIKDRTLIHRELAVKFYLADGDGAHLCNWIGPHGLDRLDLKLQHFLSHQIPLLHAPLCQVNVSQRLLEGRLPELQNLQQESRIVLQGYLFYHWQTGPPPHLPAEINPAHPHGLWCRHSEFSQFLSAFDSHRDSRWLNLPRLQWLSPVTISAENAGPLSSEAILALLSRHFGIPAQSSVLLAKMVINRQWHESMRVFVVADEWPTPDHQAE
jgi:hypothetical protein